jgi:hypothetical protein
MTACIKPLTLEQIVCQSTPLCNAVELDMARLEKPKHTRFCFDILFQCTLHHCASTMFFLSRKKNLLAFWLLTKSVSRKVNITSRISANSFHGNYFLNFEVVKNSSM